MLEMADVTQPTGETDLPEQAFLQIQPIISTNFGEIEVDWGLRTAHARVITADGEIALSEDFVF